MHNKKSPARQHPGGAFAFRVRPTPVAFPEPSPLSSNSRPSRNLDNDLGPLYAKAPVNSFLYSLKI
jgi:hypothetical protein